MDHRRDRPRSVDDLVTAYLHYATAALSGRTDAEPFWAWEAVDELSRRDPEALWLFLLEAMRRTADDRSLAYLAAGPFEDLIVRYGEQFIERIEIEARSEPRVLRALCGVWGRDSMAPAVAERLDCLVAKEPPL